MQIHRIPNLSKIPFYSLDTKIILFMLSIKKHIIQNTLLDTKSNSDYLTQHNIFNSK